ncbi:MAG: GreA/GreB family elongation factor [Bdellovibrionia bacterium]
MTRKQKLIRLIIAQLNTELQLITQSAKAAHEAATHEESKAEDSHDTRGLEASYLAGAQMARAEALKKTIATYQFMNARDLQADDPIDIGALIEIETAGRKFHYFLVSQGGGMAVTFEGKTIQVITSLAPLGEVLLGRRVGDVAEIEGQRIQREYKITGVS